jgi:excinuclease ABC subunit A
VPVWPHYSREEVLRAQKRKVPPDYLGTFVGARRYVLETFARTDSAMMKRRVA